MGFLSKLWKGVKKTVKKVARSVKKVAKKIAHAIPGGKQLWKLGTKIGKGVMKGFAKISGALGPVGMMALSFLLPFAGPALAGMWSSFGAGAAALANGATGIMGALGQAGTAIFNGANFVSSTIGSLGTAIKEGLGTLGTKAGEFVTKTFGETGKSLVSGFKETFGITQAPAPVEEISSGVFDKIKPFDTSGMTAAQETSVLGNIPGIETAVPEAAPTFLDKVGKSAVNVGKKVAKNALSSLTQGGGATQGAGESSAAGVEVGAGVGVGATSVTKVEGLEAAGGDPNNFFSQLLAQSQQQVRGGF